MVLLAGGPSFGREQADACLAARGPADAPRLRAIAVNDAYRLAPWADILYFADARWWKWHKDRPEYQAFAGERITIENVGDDLTDAQRTEFYSQLQAAQIGLLHNYGIGSAVLSEKPNGVVTGQNSGYQALNIAVLAGAARILLVGFDMKPADDGRMHWFGDHPVKTHASVFSVMVNNFDRLARRRGAGGPEIINCTPGSALACFPRSSLEHELARILSGPEPAALPV